jgi:folate-binding protein YgfZ
MGAKYKHFVPLAIDSYLTSELHLHGTMELKLFRHFLAMVAEGPLLGAEGKSAATEDGEQERSCAIRASSKGGNRTPQRQRSASPASDIIKCLDMKKTALLDKSIASGGVAGEYTGVETVASFGDSASELEALRKTAGVFDLSGRGMLVLSGEDRVRWLNGMVTNNTRDLDVNHGNYSLLLNAQGRIQGDLVAYNRGDYILVTTEAGQVEKIKGIFDKYIIMDDVEVADVSEKLTAVGVAGPKSREIVVKAGFGIPELVPGEVVDLQWNGIGATVARGLGDRGESYEVWFASENAAAVWDALVMAEAKPVGFVALEWLRILNGIPRYGVELTERYLPQETGQDRALHFAKGCYIGQEIVERIRSRALLHRGLAGFEIDGPAPATGSPVIGPEKQVGEITSSASIPVDGTNRTFGLGYIRTELGVPGTQVKIQEANARVSALPFQL